MNPTPPAKTCAPLHGGASQTPPPRVRQFRQSLLWPLRLLPPTAGLAAARHSRRPWQFLSDLGAASPWRELADEFSEATGVEERHYHEFVTFLPFVQRFLYGEGRADANAGMGGAGSPMRVFRRSDVAALRVRLHPGQAPITLSVAHVDLYFFFDVELVLLNVECAAEDLSLAQAQELMYRVGRGYPSGWDAQGQAIHAPAEMAWLDSAGTVLAESDAQQREAFLSQVGRTRSPRIAADWAWLLQPLVADRAEAGAGDPAAAQRHAAAWRFRQIEYYRMPLMAWLAVDDPTALARADFVRLGLVAGAAEGASEASLPFAEHHLADFEAQFCYDRFWGPSGAAPHTRYLCSGHSLVVVGAAGSRFFACGERGVLAQFRHEHFLLFLIAHFQKSALLMFSDRLAEALKALDVGDADSVRRFKRNIRANFEGFLRFTHRYWFREIAEQAQARALFKLCAGHLETERLYAEVKERIRDMSDYLDADSLRRQANTVVRLTVVTILGMIGTISTGFLGMNLIDEAGSPLDRKLLIFGVVFISSAALTIYTMMKSKRLSDFLDVLSDERLSLWQKCGAFAAVWRRVG